MAYVGTPIDTTNQFQSLQGKRFDGDGSTTAFTLDIAPSSVFDIEVFVENVRQDPNSAYNISGTTLTFTGAPPSGTNNIYVVHQAKAVGTINPTNDSVTASSIADDAVESEHLNNNIISGQTALAAEPADTDEFLVSDAGTIKRIDYSYIKAVNTPLFKVRLANNQTIATTTRTVVAFDSVSFDTGSNWDNTNKRYIPDEAGYYLFFSQVRLADSADFSDFGLRIRKNGNTTTDMVEANVSSFHFESNYGHVIFYMNGTSDYADVTAYHNKGSDSTISAPYYSWFQGFKLIGS